MQKNITNENFKQYGKIIAYPKKHLKGTKRNLWKIILTDETARGWRIAYLVVRDRSVKRLERHPNTFESFEPVAGKTLLFVSQGKVPEKIECFNLNTPVILKKNIWHAVVTVGDESEIKITENAKVVCQYWPLGYKLPKKDPI